MKHGALVDKDGNVFVIEANVNPDLTAIEDFADSAAEQGMDYNSLVQLIVDVGIKYKAPWKAGPNKKYA